MLKKIGWTLVSVPLQIVAGLSIIALGASLYLMRRIPSNPED